MIPDKKNRILKKIGMFSLILILVFGELEQEKLDSFGISLFVIGLIILLVSLVYEITQILKE
ncbi:MAG: hypothetical protein ACI319_10770 [Holdemanella porci]